MPTEKVEEQKNKGFAKDIVTVLKEIELKVNQYNKEQIDKLTFKTAGGDITWKPKQVKTSYEGGIKVVSKIPMEKGFLPEKLVKMANLLQDQGTVKLKVSYNWWKTEQDGHEVVYKFILSEETFNDWELLEEKTETEEVLP